MLFEATGREAAAAAGRSRVLTFVRSRGQLLRRLGWGVADQGMSSLTNFAVVLFVARELGATQFGAFSLAYVTYAFALNASRGLAAYPLQVRFSGAELSAWRRAVPGSTATALSVGIVAGTLVAGAAMLMHGPTRLAFLALGLTLPGLLLQDSWRYAFFSLGRGHLAFLNDLTWALAMLPALLALRAAGNHDVFWYVFAWGAAAAVAAIVGPFQAKVRPRMSAVRDWVSQHRDLGPRYALSGLTGAGATQLRAYGIDFFLGLAAVGYVQAAGTLMGPFLIILYGIGLVTVPEAARLLRTSPRRLPLVCMLVGAVLAAAAAAWGVLLLVALPHGLGNLMLGPIWRPTYPLVLPQTLFVIAQGLGAGAATGLGALGAAGRSLRAMIIGSVAYLAFGLTGAAEGGATGTVIGTALAAWVSVFVLWWELRGALLASDIVPAGGRFMSRHESGRHRRPGHGRPRTRRSGRRPAGQAMARPQGGSGARHAHRRSSAET